MRERGGSSRIFIREELVAFAWIRRLETGNEPGGNFEVEGTKERFMREFFPR